MKIWDHPHRCHPWFNVHYKNNDKSYKYKWDFFGFHVGINLKLNCLFYTLDIGNIWQKLISNLLATTTTNILYSYHELNLFLWYGPFNINWFKIQRIIQQILCVYLKIAENWTNLRPRSLSLCVSRIKNFSQLLLHTRQVQTHVHARIITKLLLFKLFL